MYHCRVTRCESHTVNLVIAGSSPPKSLKIFSNTGTRKATSATSTISAKLPISDRVDHRRLDLAAERGVLLELLRHAHQRPVEDSSGLPGLDHRHVEIVEDVRVLAQRL